MNELNMYHVTWHDHTHENRSWFVARSKIEASKMVTDGTVMHVSEPEPIRVGASFGGSGWSFSFSKPTYEEPSQEWVDYLKFIHTNQGFED